MQLRVLCAPVAKKFATGNAVHGVARRIRHRSTSLHIVSSEQLCVLHVPLVKIQLPMGNNERYLISNYQPLGNFLTPAHLLTFTFVA